MNVAIIFAGGVGSRMQNSEIPKQYIEIDNKPILVHTIDVFNNSESIDHIILVILEDWIEFTHDLVNKYNLNKVRHIVPGGKTGQLSIFSGVKCAFDNFLKTQLYLFMMGSALLSIKIYLI